MDNEEGTVVAIDLMDLVGHLIEQHQDKELDSQSLYAAVMTLITEIGDTDLAYAVNESLVDWLEDNGYNVIEDDNEAKVTVH